MHAQCKELVEEQIKKHKLIGWRFEINNSKKVLGQCNYREKIINVSWSFMKQNTDELVMDVILHEIAHALTRGHHHDEVWKAKCLEIGANPDRICNEAVIPKGKYVYECPKCKKESHYFRKKRREFACGDCCKVYNNNRYSDKYICRLKE